MNSHVNTMEIVSYKQEYSSKKFDNRMFLKDCLYYYMNYNYLWVYWDLVNTNRVGCLDLIMRMATQIYLKIGWKFSVFLGMILPYQLFKFTPA